MEKLNINAKKILSLMISGSLSFSLLGCNFDDKYIPMKKMFHDRDKEGIDDFFEERIIDSEEKIENVVRLERCISLVEELMLIDYKDIIPIVMKSNYENMTDEDISNIEEELWEYQNLNYSQNRDFKNRDDRLLFLKRDLYQKFIRLVNFIEYRGGHDLYDLGKGLYASVILDGLDYEGNEKNVAAMVNSSLGDAMENSAWYSKNDNYESFEIDYNSMMYKLILETNKYMNEVVLPTNYHFQYSYGDKRQKAIKEMIKKYKQTIEVYKEAMVTSYKIEGHKPSSLDMVEYDYEINCGKTDKEKILKNKR